MVLSWPIIDAIAPSCRYKFAPLIPCMPAEKHLTSNFFGAFSLIVIDEAHGATSESYKWLFEKMPNAFLLPVTATPHVKAGLRLVAEEVVSPVTTRQLIEQGFLVAPEYFAPSTPDLAGVQIDSSTGDYHVEQLSQAMVRSNVFNNAAASYQKYCDNKPALCFCVSVEQNQNMAKMFNALGIKAEHVDADTPEGEREAVVKRLESGETKVVTNAKIFTTGVDIPCVSVIILARPTKSYNLYIQILGRGTRPFPGKSKFTVLDHAGAIKAHGFIEHERPCNLDGTGSVKITCGSCHHKWEQVEKGDLICPSCGFDNEAVLWRGQKH